jgi:hypothetical protein
MNNANIRHDFFTASSSCVYRKMDVCQMDDISSMIRLYVYEPSKNIWHDFPPEQLQWRTFCKHGRTMMGFSDALHVKFTWPSSHVIFLVSTPFPHDTEQSLQSPVLHTGHGIPGHAWVDLGFSCRLHMFSSWCSHKIRLIWVPLPQLVEHSSQGVTRHWAQVFPIHVRLVIDLVDKSHWEVFPGHSTRRCCNPRPHNDEHCEKHI